MKDITKKYESPVLYLEYYEAQDICTLSGVVVANDETNVAQDVYGEEWFN